jgi:hypothetical protein
LLTHPIGRKYFATNRKYDYLTNNCGQYVTAMVDVVKPEYYESPALIFGNLG